MQEVGIVPHDIRASKRRCDRFIKKDVLGFIVAWQQRGFRVTKKPLEYETEVEVEVKVARDIADSECGVALAGSNVPSHRSLISGDSGHRDKISYVKS